VAFGGSEVTLQFLKDLAHNTTALDWIFRGQILLERVNMLSTGHSLALTQLQKLTQILWAKHILEDHCIWKPELGTL